MAIRATIRVCDCKSNSLDPEHHDPECAIFEVNDTINHPLHYNVHPSGVECIDIVEHMNFNTGNAIKYLWRVDEKGDWLDNLLKAKWYIEREIQRRQKSKQQ